ncbi:MAG: PP2C family protein-serine/threonine phosphatase, partial [Chloracidobacterium sp.]
ADDNALPPDIAIQVARAFLDSSSGTSLAGLGAPQVERLPNQPETEVRWQQPVPELPELTRVVTVRLRGETVWYFQHRVQPTNDSWTRPFTLSSVILPFLGLPLWLALLAAAALYLLKVSRRHVILWRAPAVCALLVGLGSVLMLIPALPYAVSKTMFENPAADSNPLRLAMMQEPGFFVIALGGYAVSSVLTLFATMAVTWTVCAALLHIEYETKRPYAEVFRSILLFRRVAYTTALERGLVGGGIGWALLGLTGLFHWLTVRPNAAMEQAADSFYLLLDTWSPSTLLVGTLVRNTFDLGLVLVGFSWVVLVDWLRFPPRLALVTVALLGTIGWSDVFSQVMPLSLSTPWLLGRHALLTAVLVATFERFGLWTTLCAIWTYQTTSWAVTAATLPALGLSPWLPTLLVLLPFGAVVFTRRPPENKQDNQPTLLDRVVEEQRHAQQLVLAARIQAAFLPTRIPHLEGWDIAVQSLPAREVGGDFYDFFTAPDGKLGIFVGDVSGKSVPGALFTAVATTTFRSEAEEDELGCAAMLNRLNELLYPDMKRVRMFVAATYAQLDPRTGRLTVANAGLPVLAHWQARAPTGESSVAFIEIGGLPLGSMQRTTYDESQANLCLEGQACLVITSDGVVEALNEHGDAYGYDALASVIDNHAKRGAHPLCEAIISDVKRHMGDTEQSDDITVVILQRCPAQAEPQWEVERASYATKPPG